MTTSQDQSRFVLPETRALAALGLFDLLATVYLIATHKAHEANPLFATIMTAFGPTGFVVCKALLLAVPLIIAEKARSRSPVFVRRALQVGLIAYVLLLLFAYHTGIAALFVPAPSRVP
jgi:hypothetical protein